MGITPAPLPPADLLHQLAAKNWLRDAVFTPVGYGVQNRVVGGGTPFFQDRNPGPRMYAFSSFNALNPASPSLPEPFNRGRRLLLRRLRRTELLQLWLVAITITGDSVCRATNVAYRLDTASARQFLSPYVALP